MIVVEELKVSPGKINTTADTMSAQGKTMNISLDAMISVADKLRGVWEGDAANAFINKLKSLKTMTERLNTMVQNHSRDLHEMASQYTASEQSNQSIASSLSSNFLS